MKVKDKVIVVTGGGSGLGRELAIGLLNKGAAVAAVDINKAGLVETAGLSGENNDKVSIHTLDISDKIKGAAFPEQVISKHGQVDGIINNAGIIQPFVNIDELDYDAIDKVMKINFFGTLYLTKTFLPYLMKRPEAHIINISSMGGFLPVPGQSIYGASKAAVKLFTEGLRSELLDTNVKVTVVYPGALDTNIAANIKIGSTPDVKIDDLKSSFKPLSPVRAARTIINGIEKNKYRILVGTDAKIMDIIYRINPKFAAEFIHKKMKSLLAG